jgi:transposase
MAGVFRVPDQMWERIRPLIPAPAKVHRFGGGCSRVPDRDVLDAIFFVLRTGCQWKALDATATCSSSTAQALSGVGAGWSSPASVDTGLLGDVGRW